MTKFETLTTKVIDAAYDLVDVLHIYAGGASMRTPKQFASAAKKFDKLVAAFAKLQDTVQDE